MEENTETKSIERIIIPVYFKRFDNINKGVLRLLAILSGLPTLIFIGLGILLFLEHTDGFDGEDVVMRILVPILTYVVFWLLVRLIIWIIDGFKSQ